MVWKMKIDEWFCTWVMSKLNDLNDQCLIYGISLWRHNRWFIFHNILRWEGKWELVVFVEYRFGCCNWITKKIHFLEAVNKFDCGILSDFWFDMFSNWSGSQQWEVLSLLFAQVVSSDSSQEHRKSSLISYVPLLIGSFGHWLFIITQLLFNP